MLSGGGEPQQLFFLNVLLEFNTVFDLQFRHSFDSKKQTNLVKKLKTISG